MKNKVKKQATSVSRKGFENDSVITIGQKDNEDTQLMVLSSSKSSANVNVSAIEVKINASVVKDASVIKEEEKKMGTIDYNHNDAGKAIIGGLKLGEKLHGCSSNMGECQKPLESMFKHHVQTPHMVTWVMELNVWILQRIIPTARIAHMRILITGYQKVLVWMHQGGMYFDLYE